MDDDGLRQASEVEVCFVDEFTATLRRLRRVDGGPLFSRVEVEHGPDVITGNGRLSWWYGLSCSPRGDDVFIAHVYLLDDGTLRFDGIDMVLADPSFDTRLAELATELCEESGRCDGDKMRRARWWRQAIERQDRG